MAIDPTLTATIVSSWGGKYDTSYLTIEEADAIAETKFDRAVWDDLDDTQKYAAVISATRSIDASYPWIGSKYFWNQNLEFPRSTEQDVRAAEPDSTFYDMLTTSQYQLEMKRNLKLACFEYAFWIARNGGFDSHAEMQARGITSYSENYGSVSENYSYKGGGGVVSKLCPEAIQLLRKYITKPKLARG